MKGIYYLFYQWYAEPYAAILKVFLCMSVCLGLLRVCSVQLLSYCGLFNCYYFFTSLKLNSSRFLWSYDKILFQLRTLCLPSYWVLLIKKKKKSCRESFSANKYSQGFLQPSLMSSLPENSCIRCINRTKNMLCYW